MHCAKLSFLGGCAHLSWAQAIAPMFVGWEEQRFSMQLRLQENLAEILPVFNFIFIRKS